MSYFQRPRVLLVEDTAPPRPPPFLTRSCPAPSATTTTQWPFWCSRMLMYSRRPPGPSMLKSTACTEGGGEGQQKFQKKKMYKRAHSKKNLPRLIFSQLLYLACACLISAQILFVRSTGVQRVTYGPCMCARVLTATSRRAGVGRAWVDRVHSGCPPACTYTHLATQRAHA